MRIVRLLESIWFRVQAVLRRETMERELAEEMDFHLEMETRKNLARGMDPEEARRTARLRFGGADRMRERAREAWGVSWFQDAQDDVRFAFRQMRRRPAFFLVAALTLGIGIGGTVALFSVVHGLLIRPLPFENDDALVSFWSEYNWRGVEFDLVRDAAQAYDGLAAYSNLAGPFRTGGRTTVLVTGAVSANLFQVLGATPLLGRTFRPGEDRPGAETTLVLSHGFWQREMGGDPTAVGRRVIYQGRPFTVVGVMPQDFFFPSPAVEAWQTLDLDPDSRDYQNNGWLVLVGRVKQGLGPEQVRADLDRITAALGERFDYPEAWDKTRGAYVKPLRESLLGDVRAPVLLLLGAVGLLLLMACANVASLLLCRTADRTGEIAVRAVLGAGRWRIARQVLTEAVVLGLVAGVVGIALARASFDVLVAMLPLQNGFGDTLSLDRAALVAALVLATTTGGLVALAPIRALLRGDVEGALAGGRSDTGGVVGHARMQGLMVLTEVLLCLMLVSGATLLVRSVAHLRTVDPGLDPAGVLAVDLLMSEEETPESDRAQFYASVLERIEGLPGVTAAGLTNRLPVRDGGTQGTVAVEDRPDLGGDQRPNSYYRTATQRYFRTMGMDVVRGRGFDRTDVVGNLPVAIVNETFARSIWGDRDPLGRRVSTFFADRGRTWLTVVGVVADARVQGMLGEMPRVLYQPQRQLSDPGSGRTLVLRADTEPLRLVPAIRRIVSELDDRVAVDRVTTMEAVIDDALAEPLRLRFFLGLFGMVGLILGSVGIYGVVAYSVRRRWAELGIRLALGAEPAGLVRSVLGAGMVPVSLGIGLGVLGSLGASRLLGGFLYGVTPADPASILTASGVLLAVALTAAAIPALRASRVQPVEALKAD